MKTTVGCILDKADVPTRDINPRLSDHLRPKGSLAHECYVVPIYKSGVAVDAMERLLVKAVPRVVGLNILKNANVAGDDIYVMGKVITNLIQKALQ